MLESVKRRLERLADEVQELDDSPHSMFGFALFAGPKAIRIRDPQKWAQIGKYAAIHSDDPLVMTSPPYWPEVVPKTARCIWWWGDSVGVQRFTEWTQRMSSLFEGDATLLGDIAHEPGIFGTLCALCELAQEQPELSDLVRKRVIRIPEQWFGRQLVQGDKPSRNKILVLEAAKRGPHFARVVVNFLLGRSPRGPRLVVDREKNTVWLDGTPYRRLIREVVRIFYVLYEANGATLSMSEIQTKDPTLGSLERFDRLLTQLEKNWPELGKVIERIKKKGYRIRKEYLT